MVLPFKKSMIHRSSFKIPFLERYIAYGKLDIIKTVYDCYIIYEQSFPTAMMAPYYKSFVFFYHLLFTSITRLHFFHL